MTPTGEDVALRRAVWVALSDLYLDTDIVPLFDTSARVLSASSYTIAELEQILRREVHPVLRGNLLVAAGVWDGFDHDWLFARIIERQRLPRWRRLFDGVLGSEADAIWNALRPRIAERRNLTPETTADAGHPRA